MALTPVLIVLICFIAAIILITGVHMVERGTSRISETLGSRKAGGKGDL